MKVINMSKVKIAMIGTGNISHSHVKRLLETGEADIAALSDPSESNRQRVKQTFKLDDAAEFVSHADMLEQIKPDGVVICSPHALHYRQAMDALSAGCHVLVEKPLTCTSEAAKKLIQEAERAGKVLQVSYQRHFLPVFKYMRSVIQSGKIGRITSITASLYQDWKDSQKGMWRQDPKLSGGGMLLDSGSHIIDVLLWTTGLTPVDVKTNLQQHDAPVEIDTFTTLRFKEGAVGSLNIVGKAPRGSFVEKYAVIGEKGGMFYDEGKIVLHRDGAEPEVPQLPPADHNPDKNFIRAIRGEEEVSVPGEYALRVLQLTEAIYQDAGYRPFAPKDEMG